MSNTACVLTVYNSGTRISGGFQQAIINLYKKLKKGWNFATVINGLSSLRSLFCYKLLIFIYKKL